jgi:hypothetical protein
LIEDGIGPAGDPEEAVSFEKGKGIDGAGEALEIGPVAGELLGPAMGERMVGQPGAVMVKLTPVTFEGGGEGDRKVIVDGEAAVFAPFDGESRTCFASGGFEEGAVEVAPKAGGLSGDRFVFHPDDLVVGGIIVLGKIDIVLPEEVVGDPRKVGVVDGDHIAQEKGFVGMGEEEGSEAEDMLEFDVGGLSWGFELEEAGVVATGVGETALLMGTEGALIEEVEFAGVEGFQAGEGECFQVRVGRGGGGEGGV